MRKYFCLLILSSHCMAVPRTAPSANRPEKPVLWYAPQGRIVYDLARFPLIEIAESPTNRWIVAEIIPDPCGTFVEDSRWEMNEDGVDITAPAPPGRPNASFVTSGGNITVRAVLGKRPDCSLRYEEVIRPVQNSQPDGGPSREIYDLFQRSGGFIVCQVNEGYPGRSRYSPALQIPRDWGTVAESAVRSMREHPEAYPFTDLKSRNGALSVLENLCNSDNPFLAIAAFKALSDNDAFNDNFSCNIIASASSTEKQGALALVFLQRRPVALHRIDWTTFDDTAPRVEQRTKALTAVVNSAKDFSMVRGIALATFVRFHAPPRHDAGWMAGRKLVQAVLESANRSASISAGDKQLWIALEEYINPIHPPPKIGEKDQKGENGN